MNRLTCSRQQKWNCCFFKRNSDGRTAQKNHKIQILGAKKSGANAIYITAVYIKPKAHVNDSLIKLETHLSDIYLQPDDINFLCSNANIDHSRE